MLSLTPNAANAIRTLVDRPQLPEGRGLRLFVASDGSDRLELSAVARPEPGDSVVEADGARVFLDAEVAEALDNKILDASTRDNGTIRFRVTAT